MTNAIDDVFSTKTGKPKPIHARKYACTVVNLLPMALIEEKPHMLPSAFHIPAAKVIGDKIKAGLLHVEEGIHWVPNPLIDEGKPGSSLKQVTPPNEMARSIVDDYVTAHVATTEDAIPGLFWVEGRLTLDEVIEFNNDQYEDAYRKQLNWFRNLCAMADADWNKNHNMLAVSDLQRLAAKFLGIRKDWVEMSANETINCRFCTSNIPPAAVVCPNCHNVLNKVEYAKMAEGVK